MVADAPKVFVGNKIDQREQFMTLHQGTKNAPITTQDARKKVEDEMKCKYVECSALTQ